MDLAMQIADVFTCVHQEQDGHADIELAHCARRIGAVLVDAGMCSREHYADMASMSGLDIDPDSCLQCGAPMGAHNCGSCPDIPAGHVVIECRDCGEYFATQRESSRVVDICDSCESIRLTAAAARSAIERGFRRPEIGVTMQVRIVRANQRTYFYFPDVSAKRAAELAAEACAAQCIDDVDYLEIFDGPDYGPNGDDVAPVLVADWQGRPAITLSMEIH